ncbi:MAG: Na+/H+ antiporter subunit E [Burkholderiales bacterium]|jgi:multicomponent K+:H+ antiporter subunit E|nr:Na+/H+ antiporter subunit E [Burkholderiales bacterium]
MTSLLPYPVLSALLFVAWLALARTFDPAHLVLAAVLAVGIPAVSRRFFEAPSRVGSPATVLKLGLIVLYDVIVSNVIVARLVLGPIDRLRPAFVTVPLDTTHPYAVNLLATIITTTPGTVSVDVRLDERVILVHALDCADPAELVATIKSRYERPLMEIFG